MTDTAQTDFESFLVEDVILTLGNLRGSLEWLGAGPEQSRAGLERLDRQLGLLEDRARAVCSALRAGSPDADRAEAVGDNLFATMLAPEGPETTGRHPAALDLDGISIETAILDALGGEWHDFDAPVFRSRRG